MPSGEQRTEHDEDEGVEIRGIFPYATGMDEISLAIYPKRNLPQLLRVMQKARLDYEREHGKFIPCRIWVDNGGEIWTEDSIMMWLGIGKE